MAQSFVVDSWPILEWLKGREPVASKMDDYFAGARSGRCSFEMSRLNYGEVIYSIRKARDVQNSESSLLSFSAAPISFLSIDDALVDEAVNLKSNYPIAYADAFAAALSIRRGVPLITGDAEFRPLERDGLITLEWVGR